MKKFLSVLLSLVILIGSIPAYRVLAHDADGIYYVPSIVEYGIRDYAMVDLYYKQPGIEDKTNKKINKPTSRMKVTANGQTAYDSQSITSTVGKTIIIDFSESIPGTGQIAEVGLQITNGTGDYTECWKTLPGGVGGTAYAGRYPFSWGTSSFIPDKAGTYTIYGEVRSDIDRADVYEHWDVWSSNGAHLIYDTIQAHTTFPDGPKQTYDVAWHFEKVIVNVTEEPKPTPTPDLSYPEFDIYYNGQLKTDSYITVPDAGSGVRIDLKDKSINATSWQYFKSTPTSPSFNQCGNQKNDYTMVYEYGTITIKLQINGDLGKTVTHKIDILKPEQTPPPATPTPTPTPVPTVAPTPTPTPPPKKPPVAIINSENKVAMGENIVIASGSYDPDGTIEQYYWSVQDANGVITGPGGIVWFSSLGYKKVSLIVFDNDGLAAGTEKIIEVTPPMPDAVINITGSLKENRKFNISSAASKSPSKYPIDETKTTWTITPLSGGAAPDIKYSGVLNGSITKDLLIKKAGTYKVQLSVTNTAGYMDTEEKIVTITPDENPICSLAVNPTAYRDPADGNNARFDITDMSYSTDSDFISTRTYEYCYDANNDGLFTEGWTTFNNGNSTSVTLKLDLVGKYRIRETVIEGFGQSTIPEFISAADYRTASFTKDIEVKNTAPNISFKMVKRKDVDIVVLTDYTGQKLSDLSSALNTFKSELYPQGANVKVKVESSKVSLGSLYSRKVYYGQNDYTKGFMSNFNPGIMVFDTPTIYEGLSNVVQAYVANQNYNKDPYWVALDKYGNVWTKGSNLYGNLGDGSYNSRDSWRKVEGISGIVQLKGDYRFVGALRYDNTVYMWGRDAYFTLSPTPGRVGEYTEQAPGFYKDYPTPQIIDKRYAWGNENIALIGNGQNNNGPNGFCVLYNNDTSVYNVRYKFSSGSTYEYYTWVNWAYMVWLAGQPVTYQNFITGIEGVNAENVKTIPLVPDSDRYFLYVSDGAGENYSAGYGNYYSFGGLNKSLINYVKSNDFSVNAICPPEAYDFVSGVVPESMSIRNLVDDSNNGALYGAGQLQQALNNIKSKYVQQENVTQYVLIDETVEYKTTYSDYENDPEYFERHKLEHDPYFLENNLGIDPNNGIWTTNSIDTFKKPGKYQVVYEARDNPKGNDQFDNYRLWSTPTTSTIYVHRRPVADFSIGLRKNTRIKEKKDDFNTGTRTFNFTGNWFVSNGIFRSSYVSDDDSSYCQYNFTLNEQQTLEFDAIVSSEKNCDNFTVVLDGEAVLRISGEETTRYSKVLMPGTHILMFNYGKDSSISQGKDYAAIDNLRLYIDSSTYTPTTIDNSYDLDSISTANRGIVDWKWKYREQGNGTWINGQLPAEIKQKTVYEVYLEVLDRQGAWSKPKIVLVDTGNVNLTPMVDANPTSWGWTNQNIYVTVTADDNGENDFNRVSYTTSTGTVEPWWTDGTMYQKSFPLTYTAEGVWYLHMRVWDNAGNTFYRYRGPYLIDKTLPGATATPYNQPWTNQDVNVNFAPWDALSGVNQWRYRTSDNDGAAYGAWSGYSWGPTATNINFNYQGRHRIQAEVIDNAGNVNYVNSGTYLIDKVAPDINVDKPGPLEAFNSVTVNINLSDNLSGVKQTRYCFTSSTARPTAWNTSISPVIAATQTQEGTWYLHIESEDNAGNISYKILGSYTVISFTVAATLVPNPALAGDELIFTVNTTGFVDKIQIFVDPDIIAKDNRTQYVYPLQYQVDGSMDVKTTDIRYILCVWTDQTLTKDNIRLRPEYTFIVRGFRGDKYKDVVLKLDVRRSVLELIHPGVLQN